MIGNLSSSTEKRGTIMQSIKKTALRIFGAIAPNPFKEYHELRFWKTRPRKEDGTLANDHYEYFYTELFGLTRAWYKNKRILDIGCGPRGSLEWADMCEERVGLDPLATQYMKLGADRHKMKYVDAPSEKMPFRDNYFHVVCAFNSLDHVADYSVTIDEIKRVTKEGGSFLLIVEVNHPTSPTEPISLGWEFLDDFKSGFRIFGDVREYEISDHDIYNQIRKEDYYDRSNNVDRPAIVVARLDRI